MSIDFINSPNTLHNTVIEIFISIQINASYNNLSIFPNYYYVYSPNRRKYGYLD